jgi:transposase
MEREYIGVDLHKAFFQACAVSGTGTRRWEARIARTPAATADFLSRLGPATTVAVEASGPTWAFVDAVVATGATPCVVDTRKTKLKAGHAAKTDRLDARRLADAVRRGSVVSVYVPPPAIRELREECRGRHQLVRVRTRVVQMLRALLLRAGVEDAPMRRLYSVAGLTWLEAVVLPPAAQQTCQRLTALLRGIHAAVTEAEAAVQTRAAQDPIAQVLDTLVGIGPVLAVTLRAEIGDIRRFPRGPQLASYAGLVPRVHFSGGHGYVGRITKDGAPWVRWALVEAAVHAGRRPDALGRWARQLRMRKGVAKARVALARRLCDEIVRVWPRHD